MQVLNATTKVKSLMTDRGNLITILPGELSEVMIASRNIIISVIQSGTPLELGIIIDGSYELDIVKSITGAVPYLYTDVDEAKAKLLREDIDYKGTLNANKINAYAESKVIELETELNSVKEQLQEAVRDKIALEESITSRERELRNRLEEAKTSISNLTNEKDSLKSQLAESSDNLSNSTKKLSELRKSEAAAIQDLSAANKALASATQEIAELKAKIELLESNGSDAKSLQTALDKKTAEVDDLKSHLDESIKLIENMKLEFNTACSKFNITKDENGEWIQLPLES